MRFIHSLRIILRWLAGWLAGWPTNHPTDRQHSLGHASRSSEFQRAGFNGLISSVNTPMAQLLLFALTRGDSTVLIHDRESQRDFLASELQKR
jgi:hypothetical protein